VLQGRVIADSDDVVACDGYACFPAAAVSADWLAKSPRTAEDRQCPHGVQFYDAVVDGRRYQREAWTYERPHPSIRHLAGRFGFCGDVAIRGR
jgi:uncharacterized protein (DUF427 family)